MGHPSPVIPPRMSRSCNGAKSSHDHVDSVLHLRDMLEHGEKPNPSSQESRTGVNMLPVRTVPKNPFLTPNLFSLLLPGRGAVPMGQRSCDSSTEHRDTGAWRYRYVADTGARGAMATWMHGECWWGHGCTGTPTLVGTRALVRTRVFVARPEPGRAGDWGKTTHTDVWERTRPGRSRTGSSASPRRRAPHTRRRVPLPHEPSPLPVTFLREPPVPRVKNFPGKEFPWMRILIPGMSPGGARGSRGVAVARHLPPCPAPWRGLGARWGLSAARRRPWRRPRGAAALEGSAEQRRRRSGLGGGEGGAGRAPARGGTTEAGGAAAALGRNNKGALGGRAVLRDAPRARRPPRPPTPAAPAPEQRQGVGEDDGQRARGQGASHPSAQPP